MYIIIASIATNEMFTSEFFTDLSPCTMACSSPCQNHLNSCDMFRELLADSQSKLLMHSCDTFFSPFFFSSRYCRGYKPRYLAIIA